MWPGHCPNTAFLPLNGLRNFKWLKTGVIFAVVTVESMLMFP